VEQWNGLFSRTTWVSQYQKGRTIPDFNEARDDWLAVASSVSMQIICTSLQTDNYTGTSSVIFFSGQMLFLLPN